MHPLRLIVSWASAAAAVYVASSVLPGFAIDATGGAFLVAAAIAIVNAVLPPVVAAVRLPFTLLTGFILVLFVDALALKLAADAFPEVVAVSSWGDALLAALVMAAVSIVIEVLIGANDDDTYSLRVIRRIARRQGGQTHTDAPGIIFLEIDGLGLPILRAAMRDGSAPNLARWISEEG